jgi:predicted ATPase
VIGEAILHYAVLDQMGAGGMGVVYRALDTKLGRHVALKFLPESARLDATARGRLLAEAQAAARLDDPNIGVIHAIEEVDDRPFIVMALYEGESLRQRIDRAPLSVLEATDIALQATRGLARAHAVGVVHRDVKPDNLFLAAQGALKILDFGLAKLDRKDGLTSAGTVVGTLEYMSPEQIRGQAVDARTDLWALGVVLYEMLTGISPFRTEGGMTASILKIIKDEPESLAVLRPDAGPDLAAVVERALVKDRDARYATADDMLADLEVAARRSGALPAAARIPAVVAPAPAPPQAPAPEPVPATTAAATPTIVHVVPTPSSPLVGREDELAIIATNLADPHCRVLTLFGPGGTGKTRLAIEAARQAADGGAFPDGVLFVPLDGLDDAEMIPAAIARALGTTLQPQPAPLEQVQSAIGQRRMLLVLDNYEHVMDGAHLPSELVQACSGLRVLATSRERLNLEEEWVLPLPGLTVPNEAESDATAIERCEAVQLFLHRAKRARHHFSIDDEGPEHVGHICRLVAGSPLGIELAATWVKMMSCDEIAREIQSSIDFLTSSSRNVSERHRSIRACFEYSWTLLSPKEQDALARLATFQGSFTREAAAAVAGANLPILAMLVDKSLLRAEGKRFEGHPLLRQYADEKLGERPGVREETERRHGDHFLAYLEAAKAEADELARVDLELGEILTAMQRAQARGDAATLLTGMRQLAIDGPYYTARGHTARSLELVKAAASAAKAAGELMTAHLLLCKVGNTHKLHRGEPGPALAAYGEALELAERLQDHHRQAIVLSVIGQTRFEQGADDAEAYLERADRLAREHDDALALNHVLQHRGLHAGQRGDWTAAQGLFAEALEVVERLPEAQGAGSPAHDYQLFMALLNLGEPERMLGNLGRALELRRRALTIAEARDNQLWKAYAVHELGEVYHAMNERAEAQRHFEQALALWQRHHVQVKVDALRAFMAAEGYAAAASGAHRQAGTIA